MARTLIPLTELAGGAKINGLTWTLVDQPNGNYIHNDGRVLLLFKNSSGGAITVTVTSVPDSNGRSGNNSVVVPAFSTPDDGVGAQGLMLGDNWNQSGTDNVWLDFTAGTTFYVCALHLGIPR